ncbi:Testis expressed sequence 15 [Mactra antiquata]
MYTFETPAFCKNDDEFLLDMRTNSRHNDYDKRKLKIDSPEALNLLDSINATNFNKDFRDHYWRVENIHLVHNDRLTQRYDRYRKELLTVDRSEESMKDVLLFSVETEKSYNEICEDGYKVGSRIKNVLGHTRCGVHLVSHYDILTRYLIYQDYTSPTYVLVFKAYLGRRNPVYPLLYKHDNILQPNSDFDCHVSSRAVQKDMHICEALNCSYVYLYEFDDISSNPVKYPRQILPYAILQLMKKKIPLINESPFLAAAPKGFSHTWEVTGETRRGFRFVLSKSGLKPVHKGLTKDTKCNQLDSILKEQIQEMRSKSSRNGSPKSPPALTRIDDEDDTVLSDLTDEPPSLTKVCKTIPNSAQQHETYATTMETINQNHYSFPLMHLFPQLSQKPLVRLNRVDKKGFLSSQNLQYYGKNINGDDDIPSLGENEQKTIDSDGHEFNLEEVPTTKHLINAIGPKKDRCKRNADSISHLKFIGNKKDKHNESGKRNRTLHSVVKSNDKRRWNILKIQKLKRLSQFRRFEKLSRKRKNGFKRIDKSHKSRSCSYRNTVDGYIVSKDNTDICVDSNSAIKLKLARKSSITYNKPVDSFRPLKLSEVDAMVHNSPHSKTNVASQHTVSTDLPKSISPEQCKGVQSDEVMKNKQCTPSIDSLPVIKCKKQAVENCVPDAINEQLEVSTVEMGKPNYKTEEYLCNDKSVAQCESPLLKNAKNDCFVKIGDNDSVLNENRNKSETRMLQIDRENPNTCDRRESENSSQSSLDSETYAHTINKELDKPEKHQTCYNELMSLSKMVRKQTSLEETTICSKNAPQNRVISCPNESQLDSLKNELSESQSVSRGPPLCLEKLNTRDPRLKRLCNSSSHVPSLDKHTKKSNDATDNAIEGLKENTGCKKTNVKVDALTATKLRMFLSSTAAAALRQKKESSFQNNKADARVTDVRTSSSVNSFAVNVKTENSTSNLMTPNRKNDAVSTLCNAVPYSSSRTKLVQPPDVEDNDSQETVIGGVSSPPNILSFCQAQTTVMSDNFGNAGVCLHLDSPRVVKTEPVQDVALNASNTRIDLDNDCEKTKPSVIPNDGNVATPLEVDLSSVKIEPPWEDIESTNKTTTCNIMKSISNSCPATSYNELTSGSEPTTANPYDKSTIVDALKELSSVLKYLTKDSTKNDAASVAKKMCRTLSTISSNRVKPSSCSAMSAKDRTSIDREEIQVKQEPPNESENNIRVSQQNTPDSANQDISNMTHSPTVVKNENTVCYPEQLLDDNRSEVNLPVSNIPENTTNDLVSKQHIFDNHAKVNKPNDIWCKLFNQDESTDDEHRDSFDKQTCILDPTTSDIVPLESFGTPYVLHLMTSKKRVLRQTMSFTVNPTNERLKLELEPSKTLARKTKVAPFTIKSGVLNKGLKFNSLKRRKLTTPLSVKTFPTIIVSPADDTNTDEQMQKSIVSEVKLEKDAIIKQPDVDIEKVKHGNTKERDCLENVLPEEPNYVNKNAIEVKWDNANNESVKKSTVEQSHISGNASQVTSDDVKKTVKTPLVEQTYISENASQVTSDDSKKSLTTPLAEQIYISHNVPQVKSYDSKEIVKVPIVKQTYISENASQVKSVDSKESVKTTSQENVVNEDDKPSKLADADSVVKSERCNKHKSSGDTKTKKKVLDIIPFHTVIRLKKQQYLRYKRGESNKKFIDYKDLFSKVTRKYAPYSKRKEYLMKNYRARNIDDRSRPRHEVENHKNSKPDSTIESQVADFLLACKKTSGTHETRRNTNDRSSDPDGQTNAKPDVRDHHRSRSKSSHRSVTSGHSSEKKYENRYDYIKNKRRESENYFPTKRFFFNFKRPFYRPFVHKYNFHRKWDNNTFNVRSTFTKSGTGYFSWKRRYQPSTYRKYNKDNQIVTRSGKVLPKSECIEWCKFTKRENIKMQIENAIEEYKKTFDSSLQDEEGEEKVANYLQLLSAKLGKIKSQDDDASLPEEEGYVYSLKPRKTLLKDGPCDQFPYRKAKLLVDKHERSLSLTRKVTHRRASNSKISKSLVGDDQRLSHRHGREISVLLKEHIEKHCEQISKQIKKEITDEIEEFHEAKFDKDEFRSANKNSHREVDSHNKLKLSSKEFDSKMRRRGSSKSSDRSENITEVRSESEERERGHHGYQQYTKGFKTKPYHNAKYSSSYRDRSSSHHTYIWNKNKESRFTSAFKYNDTFGFRGRGFRRNFEHYRPAERHIPKGLSLSKYNHKFDWKYNKFNPYRYKETHGSSEREKRHSSPNYKKEYNKDYGYDARKYSTAAKPFSRKDYDHFKDRPSSNHSKDWYDIYKKKSDLRSDSHRSRRSSSRERRKTTSKDRTGSSSSRGRKHSARKSNERETRRDKSPKPIPTICSRRS